MKDIFAVTSLALSIGANIPYIIEIVKGAVKPERISWLLWTLLGGTYYFSALFEGGATWFTFGELIGPVVIFSLSLKFGVGGKSRFDKYSLTVALAAFVLLFVFDGVLISLLLALIIDLIGVILTVRKLILDPASESRGFWALAAAASIFALLSLHNFTLETLLFPAYVLIISVIIFSKIDPAKEINIRKVKEL